MGLERDEYGLCAILYVLTVFRVYHVGYREHSDESQTEKTPMGSSD